MKKAIIIGAGLSGATMARLLAENGINVTVIDKRATFGGNVYDYTDKNGIIVQSYGPHVFHTDDKKVFDFLSRFTDWDKYSHKVLAKIKGKLVPVPFNLSGLSVVFPKEKADRINDILVREFGNDKRVPIFVLLTHKNDEIREFAKYVYKNVFLKYTQKQWGMRPEEIGESVINRVPVSISKDDKYFTDKYQYMPKKGFTEMIANMLCHPKIKIKLRTDAKRYLALYNGKIYWQGKEFTGDVIYTGRVDELFFNKFGPLEYRSLNFKFKTLNTASYQEKAVINYTTSRRFTRITEFSKFTCFPREKTVICKEFSKKCKKKDIPYYPITTSANMEIYEKYKKESQNYKKLFLLGRLADYKYINMDEAVANAFSLFEKIKDDYIEE